ncbi:MAG TPA: aldo/keto reductase [Flexivirga sp.]|uniref:aldo/keto reductase n=1 Tax=Flexivirga sp. TaxID=1962927 RepID=UPI002D0187F2|nr:aldo/keto reductase [Flexivirga sp.]HWC23921.1 aldo/keto reductase [Flexivirga sp.]
MQHTTTPPGGVFDLAGRQVARVGYGAGKLTAFDHDPDAGVALLHAARDLGVDHLDTAQFYGNANDIIRRAFGASDDVTIVTKIGAERVDAPVPIAPAQRPDQLREQVEDNLRSLGRDRIDVVNLRRLDVGPGLRADGDQVVAIEDQLAVLSNLRDEGLIGAIGLSGVSASTTRHALPAGIACVQNAYSLLSRDFEDVFAVCREAGVAWVPFWPLGGALPPGVGNAITSLPTVQNDATVRRVAVELGVTPAQVGLAWLLGRSPNVLVIPGTTSREHLAENVAAGSLELAAEHTAALDALGGTGSLATT